MPLIVKLRVLRDTKIQDPDLPDGSVPEARRFLGGLAYLVDVDDARRFIQSGDAVLIDVPAQPGLPAGSMDIARLAGELVALEPQPKPQPKPQPIPLDEELPPPSTTTDEEG